MCVILQYLSLASFSLKRTPQLGARMEAKGFAESAPDKNVKPLQEHAEVTNTPRVGAEENIFFTAQQMNMAPAVKASDGNFLHCLLSISTHRSLSSQATS